ncbi:hypothetical protein BJ138DRAFT_1119544, partial [Hygrophoropsis aurantiaca]
IHRSDTLPAPAASYGPGGTQLLSFGASNPNAGRSGRNGGGGGGGSAYLGTSAGNGNGGGNGNVGAGNGNVGAGSGNVGAGNGIIGAGSGNVGAGNGNVGAGNGNGAGNGGGNSGAGPITRAPTPPAIATLDDGGSSPVLGPARPFSSASLGVRDRSVGARDRDTRDRDTRDRDTRDRDTRDRDARDTGLLPPRHRGEREGREGSRASGSRSPAIALAPRTRPNPRQSRRTNVSASARNGAKRTREDDEAKRTREDDEAESGDTGPEHDDDQDVDADQDADADADADLELLEAVDAAEAQSMKMEDGDD